MAERDDNNFRQVPVDYSSFPVDASYISRGDVLGAYEQGRRDAAAEFAGRIAKLEVELRDERCRGDVLAEELEAGESEKHYLRRTS